MASVGRVIFWVFLVTGTITANMQAAFTLGGLGLALIAAALIALLFGGSDHSAE